MAGLSVEFLVADFCQTRNVLKQGLQLIVDDPPGGITRSLRWHDSALKWIEGFGSFTIGLFDRSIAGNPNMVQFMSHQTVGPKIIGGRHVAKPNHVRRLPIQAQMSQLRGDSIAPGPPS